MGAVFSLPFLALFFVPIASSYTTSLNLIFFYLTWTTLVLSHPPLRVELFATATIRLIFYLLPSLAFFLFDILAPTAVVAIFKAQGDAGLPGKLGAGKRTRIVRWREIKVALWGIANVILSIAIQGIVEIIRTRWFGVRSSVRVSVKLPMPWEMAKDLLRGLLTREALSYTIHRYVLHSSRRAASVLALHHSAWYHSQVRSPFPLTAHYDHPLVYIVSNFVPVYDPAMIFRFHLLSFLFYLALVSIEETFVYSGYTFMPTSLFLGAMARRVELHALSGAQGNFGPWGVLDWALGTAVDESREEERDEEDRKEAGGSAPESEIEEHLRRTIDVSRRRLQRERPKERQRKRQSGYTPRRT